MKSNKSFVRQVGPHAKLYRDAKTGIAWVEDGSAGIGHSCHPNISRTGSVRGMRARGWGKDRVVRSHGWIYNIDQCVVTSKYDEVAREECRCGGNHERYPLGNRFATVQQEVSCPVCEKWIDVDRYGKIKRHLNWLQNECRGGKSRERSKID